uniref:Uncharacterized protein n=1 Tax=Rhizophora mucronata TaxID=61149 RepID=A0A2P2IMH3_RHIMU
MDKSSPFYILILLHIPYVFWDLHLLMDSLYWFPDGGMYVQSG